RASKTRSLKRCLTWSHRCERSRAWLVEIVSKLRRDELHESPIVRKSPKKSGTRVTRPSELKVLRQSLVGRDCEPAREYARPTEKPNEAIPNFPSQNWINSPSALQI